MSCDSGTVVVYHIALGNTAERASCSLLYSGFDCNNKKELQEIL